MAQAGPSRPQAEFSVVVSNQRDKKYSLLQFQNNLTIDKNTGQVSLARENNLKDFKSAYNIGVVPTTGAGSEFGREAKDEARRRKYGYIRKKYNSASQPWKMQIGADKKGKKLKGTRNGGILEHSAYYIFIRKPEGVFEAVPVEEWYNFKPIVSYNSLNAEEAEEEFAKRDKNLNLFNVMVRKRLKKDGDDEIEDSKEKVQKDIKSKGLRLTEMEDWGDMSDEAAEDDDFKSATEKKRTRHRKKEDTDDEAVEDSDDGDAEAKQVDYMSDTSDSDSDAEQRANKSKYEEKGVEDENEDLKDVIEEPEKEDEKSKDKKESSSSESESESDDPDREDNEFTKAFLMTGGKRERVRSPAPRSGTPTTTDGKRKAAHEGSPSTSKRIKMEPGVQQDVKQDVKQNVPSLPLGVVRPLTPPVSRDGLTEETVKRYLMRKPMSSKDLVKIFKSKKLGLSNDELQASIANILKRLRTTKTKINNVLHFSIGA